MLADLPSTVMATQRMSAEHVWAAGGNTINSAMFWQIGTASAEGSIASGDIYERLNDPNAKWTDKGAVSERPRPDGRYGLAGNRHNKNAARTQILFRRMHDEWGGVWKVAKLDCQRT